MSHFNRWWSSQGNHDKTAKQFASIVWQAASMLYLKTIAKQNAELISLRMEMAHLKAADSKLHFGEEQP